MSDQVRASVLPQENYALDTLEKSTLVFLLLLLLLKMVLLEPQTNHYFRFLVVFIPKLEMILY